MPPPQTLKESVIGRLQVFPVVTRSMLGVTLNGHTAGDLAKAVDQLVKDGVVKVGQYQIHRRTSSFFYLASEEERLKPYLEAKK